MSIEFKLPTKPIIKLLDPTGEAQQALKKAGIPPPPLTERIRGVQENFPEISTGRARRRQAEEFPKLSLKPPHTKFSVIPSRAITDPHINTRKPLLLLLGAIGIHASVHGLCFPSQRRLAHLCRKSPSWAGKYMRELVRLGYIRRLVPPNHRGTRAAWRIQVLWNGNDTLPAREIDWQQAPWCWR